MATVQTGSVLERSVLKEGQIFLVTDRGGDIKALNLEGHGLYFRDTRHLSLFELDISRHPVTLLSAAGELNFMSNLQFANDTLIGQDGHVSAEPRTISIRRNRFLRQRPARAARPGQLQPAPGSAHGALHVRLGLPRHVRGARLLPGRRAVWGDMLPLDTTPEAIVLGYRGVDGIERHTRIAFDPRPTSIEMVNDRLRRLGPAEPSRAWTGGTIRAAKGRVVPPIAAAVFQVELQPGESRSITLEVTPDRDHAQAAQRDDGLDAAFVGINDSYEAWRAASTIVETDHEQFNRLLSRALQDLRLLMDDVDGNLVPTAGIPWFAVPFGRDSLITSMQTLSVRPDIARGTLRFLASLQGTEVNDFRDEEPGKILHEVRRGELSQLGRVPAYPLLRQHRLDAAVSDRARRVRRLDGRPGPRARAAAQRARPRWTGWRVRRSGRRRLPRVPDAQLGGHAQPGLEGLAGLGNAPRRSARRAADRPGRGAGLRVRRAPRDGRAVSLASRTTPAQAHSAAAEQVRARFVQRLAMEDALGPFWAMGLDADKRPIETVTSNPGHALWTGLCAVTWPS